MSLKSKLDALPGWPKTARLGMSDSTDADYWCDESAAALARLALAREWIAEAHKDECDMNLSKYPQYGKCDCGRDELLAALEVPNG
jgi:hypothetical protein